MKEEKDKLRDFMQEAFYDYEVAPDPEDWNRIKKTLHTGSGRRYIMWAVWPVAAAMLILIALYTGGILSRSDNTRLQIATNHINQGKQLTTSAVNANSSTNEALKSRSATKELTKNQPAEKIKQNKVNTIASTSISGNYKTNSPKTITKESILQQGQHKNEKSSERLIQKVKTPVTNSTLLAASRLKQSSPYESANKTINNSTTKTININEDQSTESTNRVQNSNLMVHSIIPKPTELIKSNTMQLYYNGFNLQLNEPFKIIDYLAKYRTIRFNGLSLSNSSGMQIQTPSELSSLSAPMVSQLASHMYLNSVKAFDNSYLSSLDIGNLIQDKSRNYLPPVTFGLNINLSLPGNWSIETGIQYTRLQSNGDVSINSSNAVQFTTSYSYKVDESLHYIGVPFIINYNFNRFRKTSFYISAGLSIEKGLIAKYIATPEDKIPGMQPIYSHNAIKGLQYSTYSGIGISYKFIRHFELFAQPSVAYYFNSQTNNNTIYSIHPLLFNLRSGIRYTIK